MGGGKLVRLEYDSLAGGRHQKDRYKRTLAYVFLENGMHLNEEIIKQGFGFAVSTRPPFLYQDGFRRLEREAVSRLTVKLARGTHAALFNRREDQCCCHNNFHRQTPLLRCSQTKSRRLEAPFYAYSIYRDSAKLKFNRPRRAAARGRPANWKHPPRQEQKDKACDSAEVLR